MTDERQTADSTLPRRTTRKSGRMSENWKPVVGYEGLYEVSDQGRVRSLDRVVPHARSGVMKRKGKILKQSPINQDGYLAIGLHRNGHQKKRMVHRLVLMAFVGPCPEGMEGCHNNGVNTDNRLENLRWDTPKENSEDIKRHGRNYWLNRDTCSKGHKYTEETTAYEPARPTKRVCKVCQREKDRRRYQETKAEKHPNILNSDKTHCANGHEFIEANIQWERGGKKRTCKSCRAARARMARSGIDKKHFQEVADIHYRNLLGEGRRMRRSDFPMWYTDTDNSVTTT